jgi:hypothetical protein
MMWKCVNILMPVNSQALPETAMKGYADPFLFLLLMRRDPHPTKNSMAEHIDLILY